MCSNNIYVVSIFSQRPRSDVRYDQLVSVCVCRSRLLDCCCFQHFDAVVLCCVILCCEWTAVVMVRYAAAWCTVCLCFSRAQICNAMVTVCVSVSVKSLDVQAVGVSGSLYLLLRPNF